MPPNILLICVDQMRADHMGCAGNPVIRTPSIDRLASEGANLSRAYVNNPLCMPSRSTLFTGQTPRGHGVRTNGICLDPAIPTLPGTLRDSGYQTASIGKIHLTVNGLRKALPGLERTPQNYPECRDFWMQGKIDEIPTPYFGLEKVEISLGHGSTVIGDYASWLEREHPQAAQLAGQEHLKPSPSGAEGCATMAIPEECHHSTWVADRTIAALRNRDRQSPFFLISSFPDPHHPYHVPAPWDRMYSADDVVPPVAAEGERDRLPPFVERVHSEDVLLSGRRWKTGMPESHYRDILAHTYGMVSLIDKQIGRILGALEAEGLAEDTVICFISDHGDLMGDHTLLNKGPFHFEGLIRIPMIWRYPGRFRNAGSSSLASLLDIVPTLLDLAGLPQPEGPSGSEAHDQPPALPGRSLVPMLSGDVESVQESVVIENDEDYLGLRVRTLVTRTHKVTTYTGHRGPEPYGELFDLQRDPNELQNLWSRREHEGLKRDLIVQLHHRLTETDSALPRRLSHA